MSRTVTEYRVLVRRAGNAVKAKTFGSLKAVEKRIALLTSDEPWRVFEEHADKGPDDYLCCDASRWRECGCGGLTMREDTEARRAHLPPIESITVQKRTVTRTAWESVREIAGRV